MKQPSVWAMAQLSLFGLWLLCLQGCALAGSDVSGRVIDVETGKPIGGAYVYGESGHDEVCILDDSGCGFEVVDEQLTRANEDGYYAFERSFHFGKSLGSKAGSIIVYMPGYVAAPRMVRIDWDRDLESPEEFVASDIPSQYFYGSGDYRDNYQNATLNRDHSVYYLTTRSVATLRGNPFIAPAGYTQKRAAQVSPRLIYLSSVLNSILSRSGKAVHQLRMAIYGEAVGLSKSEPDKHMLHRICLAAYGKHPILDKEESCPSRQAR